MLVARRNPPSPSTSHGDDGINNSLGYTDPSTMYRLFATASFPPASTNWGHYSNKTFDDLVGRAQTTFDLGEQNKLLAQAHATLVDDAAWLYICHDLNPRAMSKRVQNFKPAQSWSQDFTQITMALAQELRRKLHMLTTDEFDFMAAKAGVTLTEAQRAELMSVYPLVAAMAERNRSGRGRQAEPAHIFVPGEGTAP